MRRDVGRGLHLVGDGGRSPFTEQLLSAFDDGKHADDTLLGLDYARLPFVQVDAERLGEPAGYVERQAERRGPSAWRLIGVVRPVAAGSVGGGRGDSKVLDEGVETLRYAAMPVDEVQNLIEQ